MKDLQVRDIGYENGVLGGVISAISAFASPGDSILLHSPTYMGFTRCIMPKTNAEVLGDNICQKIQVIGVSNVREVIQVL